MSHITVILTELLPFACLAGLFSGMHVVLYCFFCKLVMLAWNLAEVLRLSQPVQAN